MPKRNKISDHQRRKIQKQKREEERRHRSSLLPSDSDDDTSASSDSAQNLEVDAVVELLSRNDAPTAEASASNQESTSCPELNSELVKALGDEVKNSKFGEKIHQTLPGRWEPILAKGLSNEVKEKLINEYLVPENCTLLQAPLLNNEIAEIIPEIQRFRDNKKEVKQQQLGAAISAITKALTLLLTNGKIVDVIKIIGDSCRILSDLHFQETQIRIKTINYSLDEPCLHLVLGTERDDTLYGKTIAKKIKDSGLSIKRCKKSNKRYPSREPAVPSTSSQHHYRQYDMYQENRPGPSGFQEDQGRWGGESRTYHPATRRSPVQHQTTAAGSTRRRTPVTRL